MMVRCSTQIQEACRRRKLHSTSLNGRFKIGSSYSSDTLKSSKTVLLVSLLINEQSVVADEDVAWLRKHDHVVNPPAAGSLSNRKGRSCRAAAN